MDKKGASGIASSCVSKILPCGMTSWIQSRFPEKSNGPTVTAFWSVMISNSDRYTLQLKSLNYPLTSYQCQVKSRLRNNLFCPEIYWILDILNVIFGIFRFMYNLIMVFFIFINILQSELYCNRII